MSQLTIYKASAGSGKTFTLARRFLTLLFNNKDNYRHILAATFTNKATEEMKTRVINELYALATAAPSAHREFLLENNSHIKSEVKLEELARKILSSILHNYSYFNISTIDSFFQKIIRAFARELRVSSNYNVELDDKEVLRKVSEQLFFDLDKNEDLVNWITSYTEEQLENGKSWNFSKGILKLSEEFGSEEYRQVSSNSNENLGNLDNMKQFLGKLIAKQKEIENGIKDIAQKGVKIAQKNDIAQSDFKYGTTSGINFLYNSANGEMVGEIKARTLGMLENDEAFYTKKKPKEDEIKAACSQGLRQTLIETHEYWQEHIALYTSIELIRSNFHSMGILSHLEQKLREYTKENNILLLSNSNQLIANIIDDSDTPFIYEKTGNQFNHYMIDEFQDTSKLQWENLKPLILNSLSEGNENLIVGDVKQSIYRWRNSDWKLLDHGIKNALAKQSHEEVLPTNWRSSKNVIRFNNTVIKETVKYLQTKFKVDMNLDEMDTTSQLFDSAYSDIIQQVPESATEGGFISMKFYDKEESEDWQEKVITELPKIIEQAQDNGYSLSDIAILVRKNNQGAEISRYLLDYASKNKENGYRYDVISNEALWVSSSYDIKFIITFFRYLINPSSVYISQLNILFLNYLIKNDSKNIIQHHNELHPDIAEKSKGISSFSLLETTEKIIKQFDLGQKNTEAIFIQAFIDLIHNFEQSQSGSINEFIEWWDEKGYKTSISTPEGQDAVNIISIHKSKGLEYKIVILPFLDWEITDNRGYLWVSTDIAPLNEMPYLPISLKSSTKLKASIFKEEYTNETLLQYIDILNIFYVALTRAKDAIYAFGLNDTSEKETNTDISSKNKISKVLPVVMAENSESSSTTINLAEYWDEENNTFTLGELPQNKKISLVRENKLTLKKYFNNKEIKQPELRYQSKDFEITDSRIVTDSRIAGKIWHRIFENISSLNDIPAAISHLENQGVISKNAAKEIHDNVLASIKFNNVQAWFSNEAKVRKEATIITPGGKNYRPDRIVEINNEVHVIDFKFGQMEHNSYKKQVSNYVDLLKSMGYENAKGFLWYINLQKVERI